MSHPSIELSKWQKKQAWLLYYFSSLSYLKRVKNLVDRLVEFSSQSLQVAATENRDSTLQNSRWGDRNTSQNWGNNAWSFLADFQQSLAKDIARRSFEEFGVTGSNQCARGMSEYSMEWTTAAEQESFDNLLAEVSEMARKIDYTMSKFGVKSKWTDYGLAMAWKDIKSEFVEIAKMEVREDVFAETGTVPARTGVYVCSTDPNAALQFAWTGGSGGRLLEASTFNTLGEAALSSVGRSNLWLNGQKMLDFVSEHITNSNLQEEVDLDYSRTAVLAPSLVARHAFTSKPCRWYFVEMIHDEFETLNDEMDEAPPVVTRSARFEGGTYCPVAGFYFTPAKSESRRFFQQNELFPDEASVYGATIWQFDDYQQ